MKDYTINKEYPLSDEQNEVIDFMSKRPQSINGCGTGLGKTYSTLTLATKLMAVHPEFKCIIICPLQANAAFKKELRTKLNQAYNLYTADGIEKQPNAKFHIFNFSSLDKFYDTIYHIRGKGRIFFLVDEAHNLQNPNSQLYKTVKLVLGLGSIRFFMTATPLGNDLEGMYHMVNLLKPGYLGTIDWFKMRYEIIQKSKIKSRGRSINLPEVVGYRNLDELNLLMKDILMIKKRSFNLQFNYHACDMEPELLQAYKQSAAGLTYLRTDKEGKSEVATREWGARLHDIQKVLDNCHGDFNLVNFSNKERQMCYLIRDKMKEDQSVLIYCEYYDTVDRVNYILNKLKQKLGIERMFEVSGRIKKSERVKVETDMVPRSVVVVTQAGTECFAKGTKVIMSDGSLKSIEEIQANDYVMGEDSKPRRVIETHKGRGQLYKITQSQADSYIVSENHILSLVCNRTRSDYKGFTRGTRLDISVKEFLSKSNSFRSSFSGFKVGYLGEKQEVLIEPYFLGLWLGDGNAYDSNLCVSDLEPELGNQWREYGLSLGLDTVITDGNAMNGRAKWYRLSSHVNGKINLFRKALREYNLVGNKHIPEVYFHGSREQRLKLLAGLINTDGNKHRESLCLASNNEVLVNDYKRLINSLGYHTKTYKYRSFKFGKERVNYKLSIVGKFDDLVPYLLTKKIPSLRREFKNYAWSSIKVEPVCVDDYYGFSIEGDTKLFLLEDGTVVHNSINLQKSNNVLFYDIPFAINDVIQMVGRVARMDSKFDQMNVHFIEYKNTLDTYKRIKIQEHSMLIDSVICHDTNLPTQVLEVDLKLKKEIKQKYVWKFKN